MVLFQHTAARRRLGEFLRWLLAQGVVSTHSRPKAAGRYFALVCEPGFVSTHSRPKAAGSRVVRASGRRLSFNTQPPEGGWEGGVGFARVLALFQHTAARRRLGVQQQRHVNFTEFQHTAARRRLAFAAGAGGHGARFNTQPPEGGWPESWLVWSRAWVFQHTAARRRLV